MQVNRMNIDAMNLLTADRGFEAVSLLQKAQTIDPRIRSRSTIWVWLKRKWAITMRRLSITAR